MEKNAIREIIQEFNRGIELYAKSHDKNAPCRITLPADSHLDDRTIYTSFVTAHIGNCIPWSNDDNNEAIRSKLIKHLLMLAAQARELAQQIEMVRMELLNQPRNKKATENLLGLDNETKQNT